MKWTHLAQAACFAATLALGVADASADTVTFGAGTAVSTVDRSASFDTVVTGTNLNGYTEGGLTISVPQVAYTFFDPTHGHGGFSNGFFHYPSGGAFAFTSISATDGAKLFGVEMNVGTGWTAAVDTGYYHYEIIDGGVTTSSGSFAAPLGSVVGFSDLLDGFDTLHIGSYQSAADAAAATASSQNAMALDNLKVDLGTSGTESVPLPGVAGAGIALVSCIRLRRRRFAESA